VEKLELKFTVRCTCEEELEAKFIYANTVIEVEPCKRCLDRAYKDGLKGEVVKLSNYIHSPEQVQRAIDCIMKRKD